MKSTLRVLSIGLEDPMHTAYDLFLRQHRCELATAATYLELRAIPKQEGCEVAVLYHLASPNEMTKSAHFIRRQWPDTRILVVRSETTCLDDALYDERVSPGVNPELLLPLLTVSLNAGAK